MPIYVFPHNGGGSSSPLLSFLVGAATLAIIIGLVIFFLPFIFGIVVAILVLVALFCGWRWLKRKFGWESAEERNFRAAMENFEAAARGQYQGGAQPGGTVYQREEVRVTTSMPGARARARMMKDVEDIEENPKPAEAPKNDQTAV